MKGNYKIIFFLLGISCSCYGQLVVEKAMHHFRNASLREWSEFPSEAKGKELYVQFQSHVNNTAQTLSLQQYDVKLNWRILLNDRDIGALITDEKKMKVYFSIPAGTLREGQNTLVIKCKDEVSDDIMVGNIEIDTRPLEIVLSEATLEVEVSEMNTTKLLPSKITIINTDGVLQSVTSSNKIDLAIRPGVVYTATGRAAVSLPAGAYKIYAGRGFEYGIDSAEVTVRPGDRIQKSLRISREVSTEGWISSDTHIHTFTHSRHGDATIEERAITLAGEGIEFPIMTDHNLYVDIKPAAKSGNVLQYFTPVVGDELTTKFGHFNVFQTTPRAPVIDHNVKDWNDVNRNIRKTNAKAVILNHARDVHIGFRPFGADRHLSSSGTSVDDWVFPANAMELINSGSEQTDIMQLYHDWFGMLNHGYHLTPVGSSDSHDVSRYIVGQGRTYIYGDDSDPGHLDVDATIRSFVEGKVMVSLGLMTKMVVNDEYGPGDLVSGADSVAVAVEVHGPAWARADRVSLYANGKKIREAQIEKRSAAGLKWKETWEIPVPKHDIFLVAIAEGPGDGMPYWPIAKPYQPVSRDWTPRFMGSTGVIWIDGDKNKLRNPAYDYAKAVIKSSAGNIGNIVKALEEYDGAVATQVAALLWKEKKSLDSPEVSNALAGAKDETRAGFERTINEIKLLKTRK